MTTVPQKSWFVEQKPNHDTGMNKFDITCYEGTDKGVMKSIIDKPSIKIMITNQKLRVQVLLEVISWVPWLSPIMQITVNLQNIQFTAMDINQYKLSQFLGQMKPAFRMKW